MIAMRLPRAGRRSVVSRRTKEGAAASYRCPFLLAGETKMVHSAGSGLVGAVMWARGRDLWTWTGDQEAAPWYEWYEQGYARPIARR